METAISNLKSYSEKLKNLQDEWRKYNSDVESFRERLHNRVWSARRDNRGSTEVGPYSNLHTVSRR